MGYLTDDLVKEKPFEYSENDKSSKGCYSKAVKEELVFHYENNDMYRLFCEKKGFDPHSFNGDIASIPAIHVSVFKELGTELKSVPKENIKLTLQSSATSGIPSSIPVDSITSKRQAKSMVRVVGDYIGNERKPFLIMDVDPASGFREVVGARYAAVSGYLNFASEVGYFLKVDSNNTYYFDIEGIEKFVSSIGNQSAVVFGFTYILYSEVIRPLKEQGIRLRLPKNSKVIHIGGWKKLESEKVSKEEFNRIASELFGIKEEDIIDIYGFTEQMGLNYPDCRCGCKHTPLYSEVIVRDVITKEPLGAGEEGLLEFISPIPHSYPGNAVLTDDIGEIVSGDCPYGRVGTRFRVIGRLKKAEIRGCGDVLSSRLKFADKDKVSNNPEKKERLGYKIYYRGENQPEGMQVENVIDKLGNELKNNLQWIRKQPIDALVGLIGKVSLKWQEQADSFSETHDQSLKFLVSWCSPVHLSGIANSGLRGNRHYADEFIPMNDTGIGMLRSTSKGLVCHWLAGNVQVLGMFVLIQSILAKNVNLLRISARDNGAFESLLKAFEGVEYITPGGYCITGNDLLKTIAVIYYDHSDTKAGRRMSLLADARIAWGGNEAVSTVSSFPAKITCEDVIMGPKLSFTAVAKETINDERSAKKLARKIAVDASVFDQTGCASTHNVFVEKGGQINPSVFAAYLAEGMAKVARQFPKGVMSSEEFAQIHSSRGIYDFKGKVYGDEDSVWTVLYSEKPELSVPIYSRVLFVHSVESLYDVVDFVSEDIQTIGLSANGDKAIKFASLASEKGAVRFPACGKMLNFESPWDGMFIMDRLVRWNTLGGPLI